ncbi:hypothetical protein HYDPIDRAFT_103051, partial [Hydnomerulius pinastri MD-312]
MDDGSNWTVSEDWEAESGLVNDILAVWTVEPNTAKGLLERFEHEPVFLEVVEALLQVDRGKSIRDRKRARHRATQFMIEDSKLWRLKGGTRTRARSKVECVTQAEAKALAVKQHTEGGHWGRDSIKIALLDRIHSPKLDASIMAAI